MKQQTRKRISDVMRAALSLFVLSALFLPGVKAQTTSYTKAESFLFSFKESNDMFLADYGDNAYQLERMGQLFPLFNKQMLNGSCHVLIVSHVSAYNSEEEEVINIASLRANRIRAYLKTRLSVSSDCVAFYIDRSGSYRDRVHVYLVESPLPWFANIAIHYSQSRYPKAIREALTKYGAIPYVDLFRRSEAGGYDRAVYRIDDPLFDRSELEDYRLASVVDTKEDTGEPVEPEVPLATTVTTRETVRVVAKEPAKPAIQADLPVSGNFDDPLMLAVKTNLLPWCTVAPSVLFGADDAKIQTGSFMPNLELECYWGGRWSVVVSGLYSDFSYKEKERDRWSLSEFSVEPRIWPLAGGGYRWLNLGLFGEYGDFDVRGGLIAPGKEVLYGRTGCFWSAGASVGSLIPLAGGFCGEVSVRAGYRSIFDGKKYRYDPADNRNYLETRFSSSGFMLGLKVGLLYRFRIK